MKFLLAALMLIPISGHSEEALPLSELAIAGASAGAGVYHFAVNGPELEKLQKKYAGNELALKRAKPEDLAKFAELENIQKEANAFVYRDRDVLDSKKYLADLELALADPKNAFNKEGLNLDHINESIRLRNKVEPAAFEKWAAANPEKAARYERLLSELDGAEHLVHRTALGKSLKTKINIRKGIRHLTALGVGYVGYLAIDNLTNHSAAVQSESFVKKSERAPASGENSPEHSLHFDISE